MKRFIRTVAGKAILFIGCMLSVYIVIASVIGALLMMGNEFYTKSEREIFSDTIEVNLYSDGHRIVWRNLGGLSDTNYGNSNLIYELTDENGNVLDRSESTAEAEAVTYTCSYGVLRSDGEVTDVFYHYDYAAKEENVDYYTVNFSFKKGFPENDSYAFIRGFTHTAYSLRYAVYVIGIIALLAAVTCFITLMCVSAKRPDSEELFPGPLNRVPFDLMLIALFLLGVLSIYLCYNIFFDNFIQGITLIIIGLVFSNIGLGLCMSIASRLKQKCFLKNTVICHFLKAVLRVLRFFINLIRNIPMVWRTALIVAVITFFEFIIIILTWWEPDVMIAYWVIEKLILIPIILYIAITLRRLYKTGNALANGDIESKISTKGMLWDFKRHGENLNNIANGITIAVEDRLKSERLKTELITNVSHDIKTPLTSVINYATLIGNEQCDNQNIKEYASVLVRQSERLTRLIDDLVEASKASSGNLDVELAECDAAVFLMQASGEYTEKLESRELTLITKQPDYPVKIMADGRRMWRIFDNLMNNICKYAQSGTRVYMTLETVGRNAVITFKNTSRDALDITESELMERFVRGDKSRNTEGNGLGLSIAKSLAELQNGSLKLRIDGDLFKAILTFPII